MAVRGLEQTRRNLRKLTDKIGNRMTEKAITEVLIIGEGYSASLTPMDTGNLLQSMYREVKNTSGKVSGRVGYTSNYAAAVHGMPGTLKGQPREHFGRTRNYSDAGPIQSIEFGGGTGNGNYWDPDAEPEFLKKAFERDGRADIDATFKRYMKL